MQQASASDNSSVKYAAAATALAGLLGLCSGALLAWFAPSDKLSWGGLALLPLWFLLEIFFEGVVGVLGARAGVTRIGSAVAVLAGFYIAWFVLRGVAV